jgi:hypothetical protein
MIPVYCWTNIDKYRNEKWPVFFVSTPRIGEKVKSEAGARLTIVGITHCFTEDLKCYLEIELGTK